MPNIVLQTSNFSLHYQYMFKHSRNKNIVTDHQRKTDLLITQLLPCTNLLTTGENLLKRTVHNNVTMSIFYELSLVTSCLAHVYHVTCHVQLVLGHLNCRSVTKVMLKECNQKHESLCNNCSTLIGTFYWILSSMIHVNAHLPPVR